MLVLSSVLCTFLPGCENRTSEEQPPAEATAAAQTIMDSDPKTETSPGEPETVSIDIDGVLFSSRTTKLVLSGLQIGDGELDGIMQAFPELSLLDLRGTEVTPEKALEISRRYPHIDLLWDVPLFGRRYSSDAVEIDLSGVPMEDTDALETSLPYFPKLEKVILPDCGIPDESLNELNRRHETVQIVWTVHFSVYSLRTDAVYFCASDVPRLGNVAPELTAAELEPIRYCTELESLDLGHMNYRNLDFLRDMKKLKYLILVQGKFSDISVIGNMPELEYLELFNNNRIIDLTSLLNCKKLRHLNIGYCYYADWQPLEEMKWLERLWMPHVGITPEELEELRKELPDTEVYAPPADPMGSTGGGWREHQAYYDMRDSMHMDYLPGGTGMG